MSWLTEHTDALVAAANFTAVLYLLLLSVITIGLIHRHTFENSTGIVIILYGVALEAFAWAVHRSYWGSWRLVREWEMDDWNQWFLDHSYLALIPSGLVLTGIALILTPFWGWLRFTGSKERHHFDFLIPFGLIVGTYILIWQAIVLP